MQEANAVTIVRKKEIETFSIYMPLPLIYQMNNLGRKPMVIDGDKLIYQKDKSLVVEKGFMAEALK